MHVVVKTESCTQLKKGQKDKNPCEEQAKEKERTIDDDMKTRG